MDIRIRTKNLELTDHLKKYIKDKLTKVKKYLPNLLKKQKEDEEKVGDGAEQRVEMDVEVEKITKGQNKGDVFRVEAQMFLPGTSIRAEETSTSPKEAVAVVQDELQRQVKEYKDKQATLQRKGQRKVKKMREKSGSAPEEEN